MVLAFLLLISGCAGGAPDPGRSGPARTEPASAVLGDLRSVDPCTLIDPATLAQFGEARFAETVSLDYCLLHLRTPNGSLAQVAVGEMARVDPSHLPEGQPVLRRGPLRIVQDAPLPGHCSREVVFEDGVALQVSADLLSGPPGSGLCGVAEAGAQSMATAIEKHEVGHRALPPNSLAWVNPCTVMDPSSVQDIPGLEQAQPRSSPAAHQCAWGEQDARSPRVQLQHTAGAPPVVLHGAAVEEQVAGRRTVISMVGRSPRIPLCSAETGHIPFGAATSGQAEVAMLVVAVPGANGIQACEFARGLAERVWPKLPPS